MRANMVWTGAVVVVAGLLALGCDGDGEAEQTEQKSEGPPLGILELPVSLRTSDAKPSDFRKLEAVPSEMRLEDKAVVALENGKVPAAEQSNGEIPKLKAALQSPARSTLALHLHATIPYATVALVLNTAKSAGMSHATFQVRKPGGSPETGWLHAKAFTVTPRTSGEVSFGNVEGRDWDEFTAAWEAIQNACRGAQTGSCAYVQTNVAKGGKLKMVLHSSGNGANLNFYRVGLTPEQLAEEEKGFKASIAAKKEAALQGRGGATNLEEELLAGPPADQALFQFRKREALTSPSPLSATAKPLCGSNACGAVVSADMRSQTLNVLALIGAAFPDGSAAPTLAFELPWTEEAKPAAPAPEAAAAE